jgi:hypothetical protein
MEANNSALNKLSPDSLLTGFKNNKELVIISLIVGIVIGLIIMFIWYKLWPSEKFLNPHSVPAGIKNKLLSKVGKKVGRH